MGYNICSFNILRSARNDENDRDFYDFISKLIAREGIVIFAFQEAKDIFFIRGLRKNLPPHWKGEYLPNSELAFVWDSRRVEECSRRNEPRIFMNYPSDTHMAREPVYGRFKPVDFDLNCEFRLINVHLYHGGDDSLASMLIRRIECDLAKGVIYQMIDKPPMGRDGNFRSIFTVVLGDYNLNCDECNTCGYTDVSTYQDEGTTLKKKEPGYCNSYDHFSYEKDSSVPRCPPSRINAVEDYPEFGGDFQRYRGKISDHVPVKLEIR